MSERQLALNAEQVARLFPLRLWLDDALRVVDIGPTASKLFPSIDCGSRLDEHLRIARPSVQTTFDAIVARSSDAFIIEGLDNQRQCKGQMLPIGDKSLLFVGTPVVSAGEPIRALGLGARDFAIHDPSLDFLFALQAHQAGTRDLRELAARLTEQQKELSRANQRLAAEYVVTRVLAETVGLEAAAREVLEVVCQALEWDLATLWWRVGDATEMRCMESVASDDQFTMLATQRRAQTRNSFEFRTGDRLHRCEQRGVEAGELDDDAMEAGLTAGVAVPIYAGAKRLGAIELLARRMPADNEATLATLENIATRFGQFAALQRAKAAARMRRRRQSMALQAAVDDALTSTRRKSEFLANVSHEIRTPMNAVMGLTELLRLGELDDQQRDYVETIRTAGQSLLAIVNNGLDLAKIEAGRFELERTNFNLHEVATDVHTLFSSEARRKGLALELHIAEDVPAQVVGDPLRIRQVLTNLVGNSVKFTDQGRVALSLELLDDDGTVKVQVADTGPGIPIDKQKEVFEPFVQADGSTTRKFGGTGLGLVIANRIAELVGSGLQLESAPNAGSRFWFTSKFAKTDPASAKRVTGRINALSSEKFASEVTVLVVDDSGLNRLVLKEFLGRWGCKVLMAENGKQAVELWHSARPDVVLMDCQMPVVDGYEATRRIRSLELDTRGRTPIIALTAHAMQGDRDRCLEAGMDDYVTKPVEPDKLWQALSKAVPVESAAAAPTLADTPEPEPEREPEPEVLDADTVARLRALDESASPGLFRELVELFDQESKARLEALSGWTAQQGIEALKREAHRFKGCAGNIGATRLMVRCRDLEQQAASGSPFELGEILNDLRSDVERARAELGKHLPQ